MKKTTIRNRVSSYAVNTLMLALSACGGNGGSSNSSSGGDNGNIGTLQLVAPKTIYSLPSESSIGYVVINNPTGTVVKNLHYNLTSQIGSGTSAQIDSASAAECGVLAAYSQCNLKVSIPVGAVAGSIGVSLNNSDSGLLSKLGNSLKADIQ